MQVVKRILVISDSHRYYYNLDKLQKEIKRPDYIIHLGDVARDQDYFHGSAGRIYNQRGETYYFSNARSWLFRV